MSVKISNAVWEHSKQNGNALVLLLKLADNAADDGFCWPGIAHLAERARMSTRTVIRTTKKLEADGEVFVCRNRRQGNKYIVRVGLSDAEFETSFKKHFPFLSPDDMCQIVTSEVTQPCHIRSDTAMSQESSLNHQEPSHVATATPAPTEAIAEEQPEKYNCRICFDFTHIDTFGVCKACNDKMETGDICADCEKPTATTADMPDIHEVCKCKSEAALVGAFGPKPEREKRDPPPHWRDEIKEPWTDWGMHSDTFKALLQRYGERGRKVQQLGHGWECLTRLEPDWEDKSAVQSWSSGLWACLKAAGGDATIVLDATRAIIDEDELTLASPYSVVKNTRALCAKRKRGPSRGKVPAILDQSGLDQPNPYA